MNTTENFPTTLLEAIKYFNDPDTCHRFMVEIRWPDGKVTCPNCKSESIGFIATRRMFKCRDCKKQFSTKVGTVFEDSPIGLDKWLPAVWLIVNCKNGISSYEIARDLGVTQKTGWFMMHRIRLAIQQKSFEKFDGEIEADESFIGGKARFMHRNKRKAKGTGTVGKAIVMGLLERNTKQVRTKVIANTRRVSVQAEIKQHVKQGASVYTDALPSYNGLGSEFAHKVVDHAERYVDGQVHTNCLENFWSLLKRSIKGTYVSVEPFHLFRYLDEQAYRFNNRKITDKDRFIIAMQGMENKRLTYETLIGEAAKELPPEVAQTTGPGM